MTKPFTTPFAENGDVMFIPETAQADGSVSYETGFGPDYSADPLEANAKPVPRSGHNELFNQITGSIGDIQRQGAADWYPEFAADGGYPKNAIVWLDGDRWKSQIDGNTTRPNIDEIAWLPSAKFEGGGGGGGGDFGLTGPTTIAVGGSFQYKISPYSSFMTYAVSATNGTATISGDTITLAIAPGETANVTDLTVIRSDGARNDFRIAIGAQSIAKPSILSPASGSVDVPLGPLLTASAFMTYPVGADTHLNTDWRIRTMAGAVVWQSLANTVNKTNIQVPDNTLPLNTQLQADVRYRGATLPVSAWSNPVVFTTTNQSISTPTITAPLNGATGIGATPTFTSTAFATNPLGADTHASSDWQLKNSLGVVIWSSVADVVNKTSITLPTGVLAVSSQYTMEVRYNGNILQPSQWSPVVSFTTAAQFAYGKYIGVATAAATSALSVYGQDVDTLNLIYRPVQGPATSIAFSNSGAYIAVGLTATPWSAIYKQEGDNITRIAGPDVVTTLQVAGLAFSPDEVYLYEVAGNALFPYKRSGDIFNRLASPASPLPGEVAGVAVSPDGLHIAIAHQVSPFITVYKKSSDSYTKLGTPSGSGNLPTGIARGVCYSPDGVYLVVAHQSAPWITIYKRNGDTYTKLPNISSGFPTAICTDAAFSPDGLYLAVSSYQSSAMLIYKRSGDTFNRIADPTTTPTGIGLSVAFSNDGLHLAVGHSTSPFMTVYRKNGDVLTKLANAASLPAAAVNGIAFNPSIPGA